MFITRLENVKKNVKKALCTKDVLTISRTRKFARKARDYKLTYFFLISMIDTAMVKGADGRVAKDAIENSKCIDAHWIVMAFIVNS
jgi:hypothetical protein